MNILCELGFHKWGKWYDIAYGSIAVFYQERRCEKCNKVEAK